jgi:hypothetical protein
LVLPAEKPVKILEIVKEKKTEKEKKSESKVSVSMKPVISEIEKDFFESEINFEPIKPKNMVNENNKMYKKKKKPKIDRMDPEIAKKLLENEKSFVKKQIRKKLQENLENLENEID